MLFLPRILRIRRRREARARQRLSARLRPWGLGLLVVVGLALALGGLAAAWGYVSLTARLPSLAALPAYLDAPDGLLLTPSHFWDTTGSLSLSSAPEKPRYLTLDTLNPHTTAAVLAAVEPDFFQENGYQGHFWQTHTSPGIAERLALRLLLFREPAGTRRRLRARLLASQMISRYGHRRVLTWYLNIADFGHGFYGLEAASKGYLGKAATDLTLSEAALLAAILPHPAVNPWDAPREAETARQQLLVAMVGRGLTDAEASHKALQRPPHVLPPPQASQAPFLAMARSQLQALVWPLPTRGLEISTTLDARLQHQADCLRSAVLAANPLAEDCPSARNLPPLLLTNPLPADTVLEAAVLDVTSGALLALSANDGQNPPHIPGSALAPWVYAVAFSRGFAPANLVWDIPASLPAGIQAQNPDGRFHGPLRLRLALANDDLVPTLHLLDQLGAQTTWATAARIGLPALQNQPFGFGLLLGDGRLSLLDLAHGLTAFATEGQWVGLASEGTLHPAALMQAHDTHGNLRFAYRPARRGVLSPSLAYLVTDVLADQTAKWPSLGHPNPLEIGRPVAVHLGHAPDGGVWVLGYTLQRVIAVYARGSSPEQSHNAALAYWHALALAALESLPPQDWPRPPEIHTVTVCDPSGLLPTADCPNVVDEVFPSGSEPTVPDALYRRIAIDRETGLRATVFTPPELVTERVFMVVPPEARPWAQKAGLPLPPQGYDTLLPPKDSPDVVLTAPQPFAVVRGMVPLKGTAAGEDFASYRVQVGQGLNPSRWEVVAEGNQAVHHGLLGRWDTEGLRGLYAVQLLVLDKAGRATTYTTQVTVDGQPPRVGFVRPSAGEKVTTPIGGTVIVQAEAADDIALAWLRLSVDGKPTTTLEAPPYTFAVRLKEGMHTLTLTAADAAGNQNTATETVTVRWER